jgi:hypothetical protein
MLRLSARVVFRACVCVGADVVALELVRWWLLAGGGRTFGR